MRLSVEKVDFDRDLWGQITTLTPRDLRRASAFVPRVGVIFNQPIEAIPFVPAVPRLRDVW